MHCSKMLQIDKIEDTNLPSGAYFIKDIRDNKINIDLTK